MRRFIRLPRKVHFLASIRAKQRRWPPLGHPLRNLTPSRRIPPPLTVAGQPLCLVDNCPTHGTLSQKDALWLISMRPWAAAIVRRLGLHGVEVEDAVQSAFTLALSSWSSFHPTPEAPEREQRRRWLAGLVWRVASKARAARNRERSVKTLDLDGQLTSCTAPSHEPQLAARGVLRSLQRATTAERWRVWTACKVDRVPVAEVARREGRPVPTIYNLLRLARKDFVAALRREAAAIAGPFISRHPRRVR